MEDDLFLKRLENSNTFNKEEKEKIKSNKNLFEKCYYLGLLDALK